MLEQIRNSTLKIRNPSLENTPKISSSCNDKVSKFHLRPSELKEPSEIKIEKLKQKGTKCKSKASKRWLNNMKKKHLKVGLETFDDCWFRVKQQKIGNKKIKCWKQGLKSLRDLCKPSVCRIFHFLVHMSK